LLFLADYSVISVKFSSVIIVEYFSGGIFRKSLLRKCSGRHVWSSVWL